MAIDSKSSTGFWVPVLFECTDIGELEYARQKSGLSMRGRTSSYKPEIEFGKFELVQEEVSGPDYRLC